MPIDTKVITIYQSKPPHSESFLL